jgi:zinc finger protein 830
VEIDEDEWMAFEAAIAATDRVASYSTDAVISAPAMTAEEVAAKEAEEAEEQRTAADIQVEDEREEAMRAIENEFAEMEELEQRVRRLKERREALRVQAPKPAAATNGSLKATGGTNLGKENFNGVAGAEDEEEDDGEDYEDDWAWGGFRLKGAA